MKGDYYSTNNQRKGSSGNVYSLKGSAKPKPAISPVKLNRKIEARLRYFTSQIGNLPGPKKTMVRNINGDIAAESF